MGTHKYKDVCMKSTFCFSLLYTVHISISKISQLKIVSFAVKAGFSLLQNFFFFLTWLISVFAWIPLGVSDISKIRAAQ